MTALRSQMNPHFIFNAIGSIQHYILQNAVKQSCNYLSITEKRISILTSTNKKKFTTTIIDLKDENGNSIGTEVNLVIPFDL